MIVSLNRIRHLLKDPGWTPVKQGEDLRRIVDTAPALFEEGVKGGCSADLAGNVVGRGAPWGHANRPPRGRRTEQDNPGSQFCTITLTTLPITSYRCRLRLSRSDSFPVHLDEAVHIYAVACQRKYCSSAATRIF